MSTMTGMMTFLLPSKHFRFIAEYFIPNFNFKLHRCKLGYLLWLRSLLLSPLLPSTPLPSKLVSTHSSLGTVARRSSAGQLALAVRELTSARLKKVYY